MKERPILFSAPMVRAILSGKKTQTRRIVKPQPPSLHLGYMSISGGALLNGPDYPDGDEDFVRCPYGIPGDRLWVRETWCRKLEDGMFVYNAEGNLDASCCHYQADGYHVAKDDGDGGTEYMKSGREASPWSPSIYMPRWASRITLEVIAVRVERLQEISRVDAIAEGAPKSHPSIDRVSMDLGFADFSRSWFAQLWQEINGPQSWSANPWVWVVEFKRLEK